MEVAKLWIILRAVGGILRKLWRLITFLIIVGILVFIYIKFRPQINEFFAKGLRLLGFVGGEAKDAISSAMQSIK